MRSKRIFQTLFLLFVASTFLSGCINVDREFRMTRNEIIDSLDEITFKKDVEFKIGRELLLPMKIATSFMDIDAEARGLMRKIHGLQIGVFKIENADKKMKPLPRKLESRLRNLGFQPIVKTKSKDENVWIFVQTRHERLKGMYVISLNRDEMVLVEMNGKLGELIEEAVRERGFRKKRETLLAENL